MNTTKYDAILPPSRLDRELDAAIEASNAAYLAIPEEQRERETREYGERWSAILKARDVAGSHGVVLPALTASDIVKALRGEETPLSAETLARMIEDVTR